MERTAIKRAALVLARCVQVFLHVASRKVFVSPTCLKSDSAWMRTQAEAFVSYLGPDKAAQTLVTRDRDVIYTPGFDETLTLASVTVRRNRFRSPNLQAYVERSIQSI